jgi:hypothetical protein
VDQGMPEPELKQQIAKAVRLWWDVDAIADFLKRLRLAPRWISGATIVFVVSAICGTVHWLLTLD